MAEIMDFTDYAKPFDFKYGDGVYRIPAFGKQQIEKLMEFSKKFDEEKVEDESKAGSFFGVQDEYLVCALLKKNASEVYVKCEIGEFINWPIKLKNKIMKHINDQMSAVTEEDEVSKKS